MFESLIDEVVDHTGPEVESTVDKTLVRDSVHIPTRLVESSLSRQQPSRTC